MAHLLARKYFTVGRVRLPCAGNATATYSKPFLVESVDTIMAQHKVGVNEIESKSDYRYQQNKVAH
jgi:hypothetical protein